MRESVFIWLLEANFSIMVVFHITLNDIWQLQLWGEIT